MASILATEHGKFQSTHPLRGATSSFLFHFSCVGFQSTHPLRGATFSARRCGAARTHFNPRTPCGVRRPTTWHGSATSSFQSTHPLRGATSASASADLIVPLFQSTHPLRGATRVVDPRLLVTIHFNPRTPCGVRPASTRKYGSRSSFQSTHPLRGATVRDTAGERPGTISIHAPLAGCDARCGRLYAWNYTISIHAPLAGCDPRTRTTPTPRRTFQSTHPLRGATAGAALARAHGEHFNPRTPCGVRQQKRTKKCGTFAQKV